MSGDPDSAFDETETMNNTVYKTFKLHPDQKEIVEAAIQDVKQHTGTNADTVALELICQQYMGTGIAFPDATSAMTAEYKKAGDETTFLTVVAESLTEILGKGVTITTDEK
jgi:hypothetical protein